MTYRCCCHQRWPAWRDHTTSATRRWRAWKPTVGLRRQLFGIPFGPIVSESDVEIACPRARQLTAEGIVISSKEEETRRKGKQTLARCCCFWMFSNLCVVTQKLVWSFVIQNSSVCEQNYIGSSLFLLISNCLLFTILEKSPLVSSLSSAKNDYVRESVWWQEKLFLSKFVGWIRHGILRSAVML